jgi:hypothetical protein
VHGVPAGSGLNNNNQHLGFQATSWSGPEQSTVGSPNVDC